MKQYLSFHFRPLLLIKETSVGQSRRCKLEKPRYVWDLKQKRCALGQWIKNVTGEVGVYFRAGGRINKGTWEHWVLHEAITESVIHIRLLLYSGKGHNG